MEREHWTGEQFILTSWVAISPGREIIAEIGGRGRRWCAAWDHGQLGNAARAFLEYIRRQPADENDCGWKFRDSGGSLVATIDLPEGGAPEIWCDPAGTDSAFRRFLREAAQSADRPCPEGYAIMPGLIGDGGRFANPEHERAFQADYLARHDVLHDDSCADAG